MNNNVVIKESLKSLSQSKSNDFKDTFITIQFIILLRILKKISHKKLIIHVSL